jgi:hypothetical protein
MTRLQYLLRFKNSNQKADAKAEAKAEARKKGVGVCQLLFHSRLLSILLIAQA